MTSSHSLIVVLALAVFAAACDTEPLAPPEANASVDSLDVLLSQASGRTAEAEGRSGGSPVFDVLAAEIPGFGGLYRAGRCDVVVVLTPEGDRGQALEIVRRVLLPLVEPTCGESLTLGWQAGQFTYLELSRYLSAAAPLERMQGVHSLHIEFSINRLVVKVASRSVAEAVRGRLAELGIPLTAVVIRITGRA